MLIWLLAIIGVLVIAGLSIYAGTLLSQLRKQNKATAKMSAKRNDYLYESIYTIALSMQQEQCPLSEGCIRIAVLLDNLPEAEQKDFAGKFPHIHEMYERIKHMPTHEARKNHPRKDILKMDKEREGHEEALELEIQADVVNVLEWVRKTWAPAANRGRAS